jgi:hypothetical protein
MDKEQQSTEKYHQEIKKLRQADLVIIIVLLIVCVVWISLTLRIPQFDEKHTWPGLLPMVLLAGIVVMACGMLLFIYIPHPEYRNLSNLFRQSWQGFLKIGPFHRGLLTLAILFVYIFGLLSVLPSVLPPSYSYVVSTAVFIYTLITVFRAASWWLAGLVAIVATASLYIIFGEFYRVPLP